MINRVNNRVRPLILLSLTGIIAACAGKNPHDPYESYNRKMYAFNTAFDKAITKPVAEGYTKVVPEPIRKSVGHAFSNLGDTRTAVIDVTQGQFGKAVESVHRFVFNSTFGLLGFVDLTEPFNLPKKHTNDFGTTLAKYGWEKSNYFVIPFMGPSTPRDGVGVIGDIAATPHVYMANKYVNAGLTTAGLVQLRSELLDVDSVTKKAALDEYVFQREAYMQYRDNLLRERGAIKSNQNRAIDELEDEELSIAELARRRNQAEAGVPAPVTDTDLDEDELSLSDFARMRNQ